MSCVTVLSPPREVTPNLTQSGRPSNFLSSLKLLVQRPLGKTRVEPCFQDDNRESQSHSQLPARNKAKEAHSPAQKLRAASQPCYERRRRQDSMADYLTLEELEAVWQQQDSNTRVGSDRWKFREEALLPLKAPSQQPVTLACSDIHPAFRPPHYCPRQHCTRTNAWCRFPSSANQWI